LSFTTDGLLVSDGELFIKPQRARLSDKGSLPSDVGKIAKPELTVHAVSVVLSP